jgi:hypothetical protein
VVARIMRSLTKLFDGYIRRRDVGVAKAEIDHVVACSTCCQLQCVDLSEDVRWQALDSAEFHQPRLSDPVRAYQNPGRYTYFA